jgi:hypothetical protein
MFGGGHSRTVALSWKRNDKMEETSDDSQVDVQPDGFPQGPTIQIYRPSRHLFNSLERRCCSYCLSLKGAWVAEKVNATQGN